MQVVSVLIGSCKFCVCLFYRRPSNCAEVLDSLYSVLCNVDVSLFSHFVLIGDFIDFMSPRQPLFSMLQCITSSCHKLLPDPPITVTLVWKAALAWRSHRAQATCVVYPSTTSPTRLPGGGAVRGCQTRPSSTRWDDDHIVLYWMGLAESFMLLNKAS